MNHDVNCGTLLWIGDRSIAEFGDIYQFCVSQVAQIAPRRNIEEAISRPATAVRRILMARSTRQEFDPGAVDRLIELYPDASLSHLLGPLCEGMPTTVDGTPKSQRLDWHRWNQLLPHWLGPCGAPEPPSPPRSRSVAVMTSTFAAAEPLLDLAQSSEITAIWCRDTECMQIRNVDTVWWDDSLAGPTSASGWRRRIAALGPPNGRRRHAWIANSPRLGHHRAALEGGIDDIFSKPYRIDCLLQTLGNRDTECSPQICRQLKAA